MTTGNSGGTKASVRIVNSTIANNRAVTTGGSSFAMGGGVYAGNNHTVEIESSTIAGNSVANGSLGYGGNVYSQTGIGATGSFAVSNSILAEGVNSAPTGGSCFIGAGSRTIAMTGRNLIDDTSCGQDDGAAHTVAPAKLRSLGNNGGPTNTRPPAPDSPALNALATCPADLSADQRGQARPIGPACDLGAVELGAAVTVSAALSNPAPSPGGDVILTATVTNQGLDTSTGTTLIVSVSGGGVLLGGSCPASGSATSCPLTDLPVGTSATVILAARAPQSGSASFQVSVTAQQPDTNLADNSVTVQATVPATPPPAPLLTIPGGAVTLSTSVPVRWTGSAEATGYEVQRALKRPGRALGGYATWRSLTASARSTTMTGAVPGYGYCLRVRALGTGGGVSAWSAPRCATMPGDDRALVGRTGWARGVVKTAYLRTVSSSRTKGATLTLATSRGSMVALVVTKTPGGGNIGVYVRGRRVAVVATAARRAAVKVVVPLRIRTVGYPLVLRVDAAGARGVTIDGIAQLP